MEKQKTPEEIFEQYRNVCVKGAIGYIIFRAMPMPDEVAKEIWKIGRGVPLDIVPDSYWSPPELPFPRFSEEWLGKDF